MIALARHQISTPADRALGTSRIAAGLMLALLMSVATGRFDTSVIGVGNFALVADGRLQLASGEVLAGGDEVPEGQSFEALESTTLTTRSAQVELSAGADGTGIGTELSIEDGSVLVDGDRFGVRAPGADLTGSGTWRVDTRGGTRIAAYDGSVSVAAPDSSRVARSLASWQQVRLRQSQFSEPEPLRYSVDDIWDARHAQTLFEIDDTVSSSAAGLSTQLGAAARPQSFYTELLGVESSTGQLSFAAREIDLEARPATFGPPAEVMVDQVAAATVATVADEDFTQAHAHVRRTRTDGGTWGVVLASKGVDAQTFASAIDTALGRIAPDVVIQQPVLGPLQLGVTPPDVAPAPAPSGTASPVQPTPPTVTPRPTPTGRPSPTATPAPTVVPTPSVPVGPLPTPELTLPVPTTPPGGGSGGGPGDGDLPVPNDPVVPIPTDAPVPVPVPVPGTGGGGGGQTVPAVPSVTEQLGNPSASAGDAVDVVDRLSLAASAPTAMRMPKSWVGVVGGTDIETLSTDSAEMTVSFDDGFESLEDPRDALASGRWVLPFGQPLTIDHFPVTDDGHFRPITRVYEPIRSMVASEVRSDVVGEPLPAPAVDVMLAADDRRAATSPTARRLGATQVAVIAVGAMWLVAARRQRRAERV